MINFQWTKFERKSIVSFISEELPTKSGAGEQEKFTENETLGQL